MMLSKPTASITVSERMLLSGCSFLLSPSHTANCHKNILLPGYLEDITTRKVQKPAWGHTDRKWQVDFCFRWHQTMYIGFPFPDGDDLRRIGQTWDCTDLFRSMSLREWVLDQKWQWNLLINGYPASHFINTEIANFSVTGDLLGMDGLKLFQEIHLPRIHGKLVQSEQPFIACFAFSESQFMKDLCTEGEEGWKKEGVMHPLLW